MTYDEGWNISHIWGASKRNGTMNRIEANSVDTFDSRSIEEDGSLHDWLLIWMKNIKGSVAWVGHVRSCDTSKITHQNSLQLIALSSSPSGSILDPHKHTILIQVTFHWYSQLFVTPCLEILQNNHPMTPVVSSEFGMYCRKLLKFFQFLKSLVVQTWFIALFAQESWAREVFLCFRVMPSSMQAQLNTSWI